MHSYRNIEVTSYRPIAYITSTQANERDNVTLWNEKVANQRTATNLVTIVETVIHEPRNQGSFANCGGRGVWVGTRRKIFL